ncbi:MAG: hypothetical protein OSA89_15010 [Mariniblastus sp.]|jgi:hypothetical protein|nr:hypothetical protein [Mariniblastus sp.]
MASRLIDSCCVGQGVFFALGFLTLISTGCRTQPNWGPQGTIGQQRSNAIQHDPFPRDDLAPPILGGRPLGFEQPKSESVIAQGSPFSSKRPGRGLVQPAYGF